MTAPSIGTLSWRPAADRPDLLAAPVAAMVGAIEVGFYVSEIDPTLADTAAFCAAYDVSPDASANCVVVAGRRAETTTMAACLVLASDRADVNKTVRKHLDVRKISFAPMEDARGPDRHGVRRHHPRRAAGGLADPGGQGGDRV